MVEQEAEALVGLLGGAEAGELAHRPEPAAVHRRVDAARERKLAGEADPLVERADVLGAVERLDRLAAQRREQSVALGRLRIALAKPALGFGDGSRGWYVTSLGAYAVAAMPGPWPSPRA